MTRKVAGSKNMMNKSTVPLGTELPKRHIRLSLDQETPIYLQDPNSPTKHPSRDEKYRGNMLDNLTKFLTKNTVTAGQMSRQQPAGWREKDPADHMGSIMNQTIIRVPHQKQPLPCDQKPEVSEALHAKNIRVLSEILNHQMVAQSHENTRHTSYLRTQQRYPLRVMEPANLNRGDEPVMQIATQQRISHNVTLLFDMLYYLEYRLPSYMVIKPKTSLPHLRERKE